MFTCSNHKIGSYSYLYSISRKFREKKIVCFILKIECQILRRGYFSNFLKNNIVNYTMSKWGVLLAIHYFRDMKSLANNTKIEPR